MIHCVYTVPRAHTAAARTAGDIHLKLPFTKRLARMTLQQEVSSPKLTMGALPPDMLQQQITDSRALDGHAKQSKPLATQPTCPAQSPPLH